MIDEKGRLFGKINIIDLIIVVVLVIAAALIGFKFLGRGENGLDGAGGTKLTYTALVENVKPEVYENIKTLVDADDAWLMASGQRLNGKVTAVTAEPHKNTAVTTTSDGTLVAAGGPDCVDLTFTIQCVVEDPLTNSVGTQEVRIGKNHIVKTDKFELANGVILSCAWGDEAA